MSLPGVALTAWLIMASYFRSVVLVCTRLPQRHCALPWVIADARDCQLAGAFC